MLLFLSTEGTKQVSLVNIFSLRLAFLIILGRIFFFPFFYFSFSFFHNSLVHYQSLAIFSICYYEDYLPQNDGETKNTADRQTMFLSERL